METRFETLNNLESKLYNAISMIKNAKKQDAEAEHARENGFEDDAEEIEKEYGNTINDLVEVLRDVQKKMNKYMDDDEFFFTDRL